MGHNILLGSSLNQNQNPTTPKKEMQRNESQFNLYR